MREHSSHILSSRDEHINTNTTTAADLLIVKIVGTTQTRGFFLEKK